jgi:hypothetical protein
MSIRVLFLVGPVRFIKIISYLCAVEDSTTYFRRVFRKPFFQKGFLQGGGFRTSFFGRAKKPGKTVRPDGVSQKPRCTFSPTF